MPTMAAYSKEPFGEPFADPAILLASDSERLGSSMHRMLQEKGFDIAYAGDYAALEAQMHLRSFDVVLLEVTGEHAVESAVEAALRVKRANAQQFVGYVADQELDASGLAGDAVFPRNATRLPEALRSFFSSEVNGND